VFKTSGHQGYLIKIPSGQQGVNHGILILRDRNRPYCQPDFWVVIVLWLEGYGPSTKKFCSHSHILPVSLNHLWSIRLTSDSHYMPVWSKLTCGCRHVTTLTLVYG